MIERGYTWTEQYRHECEVRFLLSMPTRAQRAAYLDGLERKRGDAAVARLKADLTAAWRAARGAPSPREVGPRPPAAGPVHLEGEPLEQAIPRVVGSFPPLPHGGNSDPADRVVSGVSA